MRNKAVFLFHFKPSMQTVSFQTKYANCSISNQVCKLFHFKSSMQTVPFQIKHTNCFISRQAYQLFHFKPNMQIAWVMSLLSCISVFYGSQTGNAQSIAEAIHKECG